MGWLVLGDKAPERGEGGGVVCVLKEGWGVSRSRVGGRNREAVMGFFRGRKAMTPTGSGSIFARAKASNDMNQRPINPRIQESPPTAFPPLTQQRYFGWEEKSAAAASAQRAVVGFRSE